MIRIIFDGGQIMELNNINRIIIDREDRTKIEKFFTDPLTLDEVIIFKEGSDE